MEGINWTQWASKDASVEDVAKEICAELGVSPEGTMTVSSLDYIMEKVNAEKTKNSFVKENKKIAKTNDNSHAHRGALVEKMLQKALAKNLLHEDNPVIDLFNMNVFKNRMEELLLAFDGVIGVHAMAVKSNPMRGVLREVRILGLGAECASYPEAIHSLRLGFEPRKVIYDTPCKPYHELKEMIQAGVYINLDNMVEIQKVQDIFKELGGKSVMDLPIHQKQIGLRINPVVGGGVIQSTSTATASSKFGLPLTEETAQSLYSIFEENPWLQGVHVHVGSQGCALQMLVAGASRAADFAESTNARLGKTQIQVIDIGGGIPITYDGLLETNTYDSYVKELKEHVPALFSGTFEIVTEFGRSLCVKSGITVTKVEAVKTWCNQRQVVVHVGANQFLRTAYLPHQWAHVFSVFTPTGVVKTGNCVSHDIAGPMCFSGDYLAKGVMLPPIEAGDYLVIHDTGGYTSAMYSKYNSRRATATYSYENESFAVLKARETCTETLAFWGLEEPESV